MVVVFSVFVTLSFIDFKQMGVGLAAAVLIDATIIRGVLLPASMRVLGDWNWYLPSWLEWLPHVAFEGDVPPAPAEGEYLGQEDEPQAEEPNAEKPEPAGTPA
jgi:RND superfamily putative drug exporter